MRYSLPASIIGCLLTLTPAYGGDWAAGVNAFKAKNYSEAIKNFQELIEDAKAMGAENNPEQAPLYYMLGTAQVGAGQVNQAIESLNKAIELNPSDTNAKVALSQAQYKKGDYKGVIATLSKVDKNALPAASKAAVEKMLAGSYEKVGDTGRALASFEEAAKNNPNDASVQFVYGLKALENGYTNDAVRALSKAASLDGSKTNYHSVLVKAMLRQGRESQGAAKDGVYKNAIAAARKLTALDSSYDSLLLLGEAQLGGKAYGDAAGTFKQASAKKTSDWLPKFYEGQALTAMKQYDAALSPLNQAVSLASGDNKKRAYKQIGFVKNQLKDYDGAIAAYQAAGDSAEAARIEENKRIAAENKQIEQQNQAIEELEREKKKLEEQMKALPGS